MAQVFRIADSAGSVTYDFLTGVLKPRANTWTITPTGDGLVQETFELVGEASDANIMTAIQTIDELTEECDLFWSNDKYSDSIWYEYSATSETAKRALIHDITLTPLARGQYQPILGGTAAFYALTISRSEAWEDRTGTAISISSDLSLLGGTALVAAQKGSLPARISYVDFTEYTTGGDDDVYKVWCGIRPTRGGVSSFNPLWELEGGTLVNDTAGTADATASGGSAAFCNFTTTATMAVRASMTVDDACADTNYNHFIGRYLVLLRYKVGGAGIIGVQLKSGPSASVNLVNHEIKYVTSTQWLFTELGEISIPQYGFRGRATDFSVKNYTLKIFCEQTSGSPDFYMDCLVLVPSEHLFVADGVDLNAATHKFEVLTDEAWNNTILVTRGDSHPDTGASLTVRNWYLPIEGGLLVVAGTDNLLNAYDDKITVGSLNSYLRHKTHREV